MPKAKFMHFLLLAQQTNVLVFFLIYFTNGFNLISKILVGSTILNAIFTTTLNWVIMNFYYIYLKTFYLTQLE